MLLKATAVYRTNTAVDTVDAELVGAEKDDWSICFVGGESGCVVAGVVSMVPDPYRKVSSGPVGGGYSR